MAISTREGVSSRIRGESMRCAFCNSFMMTEEIENYHYAVRIVGSTYPICNRCDNYKTPTKEMLSVIAEEVSQ